MLRTTLLSASALCLITLAPLSGCDSDDGGGTPKDTVDDTVAGDTSAGDDTTEADTGGAGALVVINEVFTHGDDWVELYNAGDAAADVSGWVFRDDNVDHEYVFPPSSIIPAGAYRLLNRDAEVGFDFGLGDADSALLYDGDTRVDGITWTAGEIPAPFSFGRYPNGTGAFTVRYRPTPGAANEVNPEIVCDDGVLEGDEVCDGDDFGGVTCESLGWQGGELSCEDRCKTISTANCTAHAAALVLNEVTSDGADRIELYNGTDAAVDLADWQLEDDGGNVWTFPADKSVAAGGYLVLVKGAAHKFGVGGDDALELRDASGAVVDATDWDEGAAVVSWCRTPNGVGGFQSCATPTFGSANP